MEQLRHMCLEEKVGRDGAAGKGYNALTQSAKEWTLEPAKPCSGERLLLMFDRWQGSPSESSMLPNLCTADTSASETLNGTGLEPVAPAAHVL